MPTDSNEVWDRGACAWGGGEAGTFLGFKDWYALGTSPDSYVSKCLKPSASRDQWKDKMALFPKTSGCCLCQLFLGVLRLHEWRQMSCLYCKLPGDPGTKICASEKSAPWWNFEVLGQGALIADGTSPRCLFQDRKLKGLVSFWRRFPPKKRGIPKKDPPQNGSKR